CAQEILSLFMLAIAAEIKKVGGDTFDRPPTDMATSDRTRVPRTIENTVFRDMAREIVKTGIAYDIPEAYMLIIPAFARYNLLP
ncbi:hypothetical protein B0T14DRAFT_386544, partial [Immersiella caudata]